jgi:hypothetical protein
MPLTPQRVQVALRISAAGLERKQAREVPRLTSFSDGTGPQWSASEKADQAAIPVSSGSRLKAPISEVSDCMI